MSSYDQERQPLTDDEESSSPSDSGEDTKTARWTRSPLLLNLLCALVLVVAVTIAVRCLIAGHLGTAAGPGAARVMMDRQCDGEGRTGAPVDNLHVHYMMMAVDQVPRASIWAEFFAGARPGSYSAWIHCKEPDRCKADMARGNLTAFQVVPPVYNAWCDDLVSPVLQLLRVALAEQVSPPGVSEKFVLVSESTLPLKPLRVIQSELGKHPDASNFCVYPTNEWANSTNHSDLSMVAASQWIVFARTDAEALTDRFPPPSLDNPIQAPDVANLSYASFDQGLDCLDEFSLFWAIFGPVRHDTAMTSYPGVGPLRSNFLYVQGCCQTLAWFGGDWSLEHYAEHSVLAKTWMELLDAPGSDVLQPLLHNSEYPFTIDGLGPAGMRLLRRSPFLFSRKFSSNASLPGYAGIMFD